MDRPRTIFPQVAGVLQLAPQAHHQVFGGRIGAADLRRDRRMGCPIDALQRKVRCASHPPLHGGQAYLVLPSNGAHRLASAHLHHHRPAFLLPTLPAFLTMTVAPRAFFSTAYRPRAYGTPVTEKLWHLALKAKQPDYRADARGFQSS